MSWYEDIEDMLNAENNTDINITVDDIDTKSITFSVYDCEVTEEVLDVINKTLDFIKHDMNLDCMTCITHHPSKNGSAECFNLRFELDVGEDEESEEELEQKRKDLQDEIDFECYRERKAGLY